jgi:hypothetical protein
MNERSDIDRVLRRWMEDGPSAMPDRVVDVVADRISVQPQRRSWPRLRRSPMSPFAKVLAAAAAVVIVAVVGWNLLPGRSGGIGGPSPSPTVAPSPTLAPSPTPVPSAAAIACDGGIPGCAGSLTAGRNATANFKPAFTFEIPAGWSNTLDRARAYTFYAPNNTLSLQAMSQTAIPEQDAECSAKRKVGAGNTVADWVAFLTSHQGLVASVPESVTVGGYSGVRVAFHRASTWTKTCPNSIGPAILLITDSGPVPDRKYWIDDQYVVFTIVDVAGETVIIHLESGPSAAASTRDLDRIQPIIDSIQFTP